MYFWKWNSKNLYSFLYSLVLLLKDVSGHPYLPTYKILWKSYFSQNFFFLRFQFSLIKLLKPILSFTPTHNVCNSSRVDLLEIHIKKSESSFTKAKCDNVPPNMTAYYTYTASSTYQSRNCLAFGLKPKNWRSIKGCVCVVC